MKLIRVRLSNGKPQEAKKKTEGFFDVTILVVWLVDVFLSVLDASETRQASHPKPGAAPAALDGRFYKFRGLCAHFASSGKGMDRLELNKGEWRRVLPIE